MKILYDYQAFQNQSFGGVSRYFSEVISRLKKQSGVSVELPIRYSNNDHLHSMDLGTGNIAPIKSFLGGRNFPGSGKLERLRNRIVPTYDTKRANRAMSLERLSGGDYDLFHPTYYDDYYLELLQGKPLVLTVYDLIYEMFSSDFSTKGSLGVLAGKRKVIPRADRIIAISECTKRDLMKVYGIEEKKISVIYLGSSFSHSHAKESDTLQELLPERYILFVGNRSFYKNFAFFVESIAGLLHADRSLSLVCSGSPFDAPEQRLIRKLGLTGKVIQVFVGDTDLALVYAKAISLVFPSLYEGFGIPVLEAFTSGCPVVLSDSSSLPEVGGDAVLYCDAKNATSIRDAVSKVLESKGLRSELAEKGRERVQKFSWEKTADETRRLYEEILSGSR